MARIDMGPAEMAANTTSSDMLFSLGMMYCLGRDVPQDFVSAHKYFNLAAAQGNAEAKAHRAEIAMEMSREQVCEAQRLARDFVSLH
jgi:TPR repeat protein